MLLRVAVIALLVMALTPLISAATVQLVYTCDDACEEVNIAGSSFPNSATLSSTASQTVSLVAGTYIIGIKARDTTTPSGMIATLLIDGSVVSFTGASSNWKCTTTQPAAGWDSSVGFDDTAWTVPETCADSRYPSELPSARGNGGQASFIWSACDPSQPLTVWFRYKFTIAPTSTSRVSTPAGTQSSSDGGNSTVTAGGLTLTSLLVLLTVLSVLILMAAGAGFMYCFRRKQREMLIMSTSRSSRSRRSKKNSGQTETGVKSIGVDKTSNMNLVNPSGYGGGSQPGSSGSTMMSFGQASNYNMPQVYTGSVQPSFISMASSGGPGSNYNSQFVAPQVYQQQPMQYSSYLPPATESYTGGAGSYMSGGGYAASPQSAQYYGGYGGGAPVYNSQPYYDPSAAAAYDPSSAGLGFDPSMFSGAEFSNPTFIPTVHELSVPAFLEMHLGRDFLPAELLAEGGGGAVHKCTLLDAKLKKRCKNQEVVVKVASQQAVARMPDMFKKSFMQELSIMWRFRDHPAFVKVFAFSQDPLAMVLKFYRFGDMKDYIDGDGKYYHMFPYTKARVMSLIRQYVSALEKMHQFGIVHGDIKPANVLLDGNEHIKFLQVIVTDFGISQIVDDTNARVEAFQVSLLRGASVPYAAPEVFERFRAAMKNDYSKTYDAVTMKAGDIYAIGSVIYELMHRKAAWE